MQQLLVLIAAAPFVAAALNLIFRASRAAEWLNLIASAVVLACAAPLPFLVGAAPRFFFVNYIVVDGLGAWVELCTAIVYFLSSIFAVGYMRTLEEERHRLPWFYTLFPLFALTTLAAPLINNVGLYWIVIELTTLVSTFLVAFERTAECMEAAWKYIMIVSAGISLALLGVVLFYWAGAFVLGPTYDITWVMLERAAPHMSDSLVLLAFLLSLAGYGAKVGLVPLHTWLPDAHSESPAPVSAMLSGALLNAAMVGIVRSLRIADAAGLGSLPHVAVIVFGLASVALGALFILRQEGVKRLMAYSSVEHMGVIALGFGFGGAFGVAGALFHMLNHSLNKALMFFGAGAAMRSYGAKAIASIRRFAGGHPGAGAIWLAGAAALAGAPVFAIFISEIVIMRGGMAQFPWIVFAAVCLLAVAFVGIFNHFRAMYFDPTDVIPTSKPISAWCIAPMLFALAPLLVLGLWQPDALWSFFETVARSLRTAP
jgi:hydrogenase-4 component F